MAQPTRCRSAYPNPHRKMLSLRKGGEALTASAEIRFALRGRSDVDSRVFVSGLCVVTVSCLFRACVLSRVEILDLANRGAAVSLRRNDTNARVPASCCDPVPRDGDLLPTLKSKII